MVMTAPSTTMAVRIFEHGGPEVLTYDSYPLSEPGPHEVLVEVDTASVSRWDVKYRTGLPASLHLPGRAFFPLPQQLGREAAGVVAAVGTDVTGLKVGDHVVAATHPDDPSSREAARGLGNLSPGVELPGHQSLGAYAQYLVRDEGMWYRIGQQTDLEQAAVTLWPFSTAHRVLRDRLRANIGDTVLVLGAAGGMGQATLQLASRMGLRIIAATRNLAKGKALLALGADEVIDCSAAADARAAVLAFTAGHGVDHVIDYVGDHSLLRLALGLVRAGGTICVSTGEQDPAPLPVTGADFIRLELNLVGVRGARRNDALVALDLLERGLISTPIAARFPLAEAKAAHEYLDSAPDLVGRVVVKPWP
jgi:NADPH:quinone reductase-like Zn-dependent oxidoreductase